MLISISVSSFLIGKTASAPFGIHPHIECFQLLIRAQHLSDGRVDVTVEQIQLETGKAGGQVILNTMMVIDGGHNIFRANKDDKIGIFQGANVPWVEQCACPQGHTGLSCEVRSSFKV